jgi:hypothetical protein
VERLDPAAHGNCGGESLTPLTLARDDQQARKVRLGKGVVSAHRIERPLAVEMDE